MEKLRMLAAEVGIDLAKVAAVPAIMDNVSEGHVHSQSTRMEKHSTQGYSMRRSRLSHVISIHRSINGDRTGPPCAIRYQRHPTTHEKHSL